MPKFPHEVKISKNVRNTPGFQFEAQCNCGWNAKVETEVDAVSAANRHIKANGGGSYTIANIKKEEAKSDHDGDRIAKALEADAINKAKIAEAQKASEQAKVKAPEVPTSFDPSKTTEAKPAPVTSGVGTTQVGAKKLGQV